MLYNSIMIVIFYMPSIFLTDFSKYVLYSVFDIDIISLGLPLSEKLRQLSGALVLAINTKY